MGESIAKKSDESGRPVRCFCGATINGDVESHSAEAARKWVAAGKDPEDRCLCVPCSLHSWDEHDATRVEEYEREEEQRKEGARLAAIVRHELRQLGATKSVAQPSAIEPPAVIGGEEKLLMTVEETAGLLSTTTGALYQDINRGKFESCIVPWGESGRGIRFHRKKLEALLDRMAR